MFQHTSWSVYWALIQTALELEVQGFSPQIYLQKKTITIIVHMMKLASLTQHLVQYGQLEV